MAASEDDHRSVTHSRAGRRRRAAARLAAIPVALACLAGAGYLAFAQVGAARLETAERLGRDGRFQQALDAAREVERAPADARAVVVEAYALLGMERLAEAEEAFARAARRHPNDWIVHRDWALVLARTGRREAAARRMGRAVQLNPRMTLPAGFRRSGRPAP